MSKTYFWAFILLSLCFTSAQADNFATPNQIDNNPVSVTSLQLPLADALRVSAPASSKTVSKIRGDVNGNGQVELGDLTSLIDILLGQFANYDTMRRSDINRDGSVGVTDVTILLDYLLTGQMPEVIKEGYDYVWDEDAEVLPEVRLEVPLAEWNQLLAYYDDNMYTRKYIMAHLTFIKDGDTTRVDSVGLRIKGNTSRDRPEGTQFHVPHYVNTNWRRINYGINMQKYVDDDAHTIQGIRKLHMRGTHADPSYLREMFCYDLFKRAGIWTASRDVYCRFWIHIEGDPAPKYLGVYQLLEPIDKRFLKDRKDLFGTSNGFLWKCRNAAAGLNNPNGDIWYDDDTDDRHAYTLETQTDDFERAKLQLTDFMGKLLKLSYDEFHTWIAQVTDVDLLLHTYAINVAVGSWDDYWNHASNYYLYFNRKDTTGYQFFFIPYDYDSTLGTCTTSGAQSDSGRQNPLAWGVPRNPLIYRIIQYEEYRDLYIKYLLEAVDETHGLMDHESAVARLKEWCDRISPYVSNDTKTEMSIQDTPAWFSNHREYNLMEDNEDNFFTVKANTIKALE